jgi:hypothetical protein
MNHLQNIIDCLEQHPSMVVFFIDFKVVTNEKQGGPGSWPAIDIGTGLR